MRVLLSPIRIVGTAPTECFMTETRSSKPVLQQVTVVAPNILSLVILEGWVEGGIQEPYAPREGETLEKDGHNPYLVWIVKDGKRVGVKVPDPRFGDKRWPIETAHGDPLPLPLAELPSSYQINHAHPARVFRKTKQNNFADYSCVMTLEHTLYLVLADALIPGSEYELTFPVGMLDRDSDSFRFDPRTHRSDAVHISQVGFRPDDPAKRGYLSQWMGLGGGISYTEQKEFELLDEADQTVFRGKIVLQHDGLPVPLEQSAVTVHSPVYEMDFSAFCRKGAYRLFVPGIGCSFPFSIGEDNTWLRGFRANMNALFCQRSGMEAGEPYT